MNYEIKKKEEKCYLVFIHVGLVPITFFGLETFFLEKGLKKESKTLLNVLNAS